MVKLLESLKVAEIRNYLTEKGESIVGKKPQLVQRLSDWLEDNGHDPDKYDFEMEAEVTADTIPPLETVKTAETKNKDELDSDLRTTDDDIALDEELMASGPEPDSKDACDDAQDIMDELDYNDDEPLAEPIKPLYNPDAKHVWISGLRRPTSAKNIKEELASYVSVVSGKVVERTVKGVVEVYAFVSLISASDAAKVNELFNGNKLCGTNVTIRIVQTDPTNKRKVPNPANITKPIKRAKIAVPPVVDLTEDDDESDLEAEIRQLDREITNLKRTFDQTVNNNKATIRENGRNQGEIARLRATADVVKREIGRLRTDRAKVQGEITKLLPELDSERASMRNDQALLNKLRRDRTEITKTKQKLTMDRDRLKADVNRPPAANHSAWPEVVRPFQQAETRLFMEPTERQMDSSRVTVTYGDSESSYNKPMGNYRKPATTVPKRASHTGLVPSRSSVGGQATQTTMPSRYRPHY